MTLTVNKYNTTTDRDIDYAFNSSSTGSYPNLTIVDCSNPVDSVKYNLQPTNTDGVTLFDILYYDENNASLKIYKFFDAQSDSFETLNRWQNNNYATIIGICVVPSNLLPDGLPRFVCVDEFGESNYGVITSFDGVSSYPELVTESGMKFYSSSASTTYVVNTDSFSNVFPISNQPRSSSIGWNMIRPIQSNVNILSDNISTGKNSSYFDSGNENSSYYFHIGSDIANYCPSPWRLNGTLNSQCITNFYIDEDQHFVSFNNPMSYYDGHGSTTQLLYTYINHKYFSSDTHLRELMSYRIYDEQSVYKIIKLTGAEVTDFDTIGPVYIPTVGEMSFLGSRLHTVNYILQQLSKTKIDETNMYLTSTESGYDSVYVFIPMTGTIVSVYKSQVCKIRTFFKYIP